MKRSLFFTILLVFPLTVSAAKQESKEQIFNERENFPLTSHYKVTPKVNIITGEYVEDECDLMVAGSEPLSFRRFYGHFSPYHPGYASWRINPEHFCAANLEWAEQNCFVAVGAENGNVICYENRPQSGVFAFSLSKSSFTNSDVTGQHHPLNTKINYRKTDVTHIGFRWEGEISEGDGSKKTFKTPLHSWLSKIRLFQYPRYNEGPYTVTPNVWTPYQLPITEERKPNGNIICYEYVPLSTNKNYPGYHLVSSITAYNSNKTKVLGSLKFKYNTTGQGFPIMGIDVVGSDGRKCVLKYGYADVLEGGEYLKYLSSVTSPNNPCLSYISDKTTKMKYKEGKRIKGVEKPDGRLFTTDYHKDTWKVTAQHAPVGPNGEMCPINRYTYHANATEVIDAEGNKKIYRYDANQRITSIETHKNGALYCTQTFSYDPTTGNLLSKKFHDFIEEFKYDKNQNVIEEKRGNGKESYTIYRTFSDDGFNLKLSERDDFGKLIRYNYVKGTNLLASEFVFDGNIIRKRAFYFYDDCAICTKAILDDGTSENPYDLAHVTYRKIKIIKPCNDHPCFGLPEVIEERTINNSGDEILLSKVAYTYAPSGKVTKEEHFDSTNSRRYTLRNEYDQNERLISSTDALGNKTTYTYDANNNLLSMSGACGLKKEWAYDKADRPIKLTDNNNLTITKKYDKLGRVISETDVCGATTQFQYDALGRLTTTTFADGRTTKKEYDIYNNVIKETDAKGFEIDKTYNFRGQVTSIKYPDGCEEYFAYRPDGQLISSIDRNGAKKVYTYDIFDHVISEETFSTKGEPLKKTTSTYSPFVLLSTTDGEGVMTKYTYDFSGKKLITNTASRLITYSYDSLGRLFKTQIEDTVYIEEFDLLNQLVEKRTETINKQILEKENYEYDSLGNKTHVITSKGTTKTTFNTRGEIVSIKDPLGYTTEFLYTYGNGGFTKTVINPKKIEKTHIFNAAKKEIETSTKKGPKKNGSDEPLQKTLRTFDKNGNLTETKEFVYEGMELTKTITHNWTYDAGNRVTSLLEAEQKKTSYQYDTHGRLKTLIKPNGEALHRTYDDLGRLTRYYGSDFDYHYQYDRCDRVVAIIDNISNTTTTRSYDSFGNVTQEKLANGLKLANTFDDSGRRILLTLPDSSTAGYSYNGNQISSVTRKNLTHTYTQTDLEGNVTEIDLPANLGKISIEYDALDRIKKLSSSYYKATFPKDAYDETGNLCCYNFTDPLGAVKESFTYDPLDQLISENDHSYAFDSINNRTQKDETKHPINLLCQIDNIPYDANGNLLECENCKFTYDSQDRLISVKKEGMTVSYTYDPFGRRLSKTFQKEKAPPITQFFIYDGDNEIGSTNDQGTIEELRILGNGLGAEIGSAVFIELKNKTYIPIHDFRGNTITLIDPTTQKSTETYRFTAFGEELEQPEICPWRFASKRHDPETHLINFGKRYYSATLGRWLTPDPQGFTAGPNLYAYITNNPLTHLDLYGLIDTHRGRGILNDLFYAFSCKNFHFWENSPHHSPHCRHYYPNYEAKFPNKSKMLDLGLPTSNRGFGFANGIKNSESDARKTALMLSSMAGDVNIDINYSATNSLSKDLYTAASNLFSGTMTPDAINLLSTWTKFFTTNPNSYYQQFCHSRGTAQVRNALRHTPGHIRERIYVVAVAPSAYIPKHYAGRVAHVVSRRDLVPWIDIRGRLASKETTTVLSPHAEAGLFDHGIDSPTYTASIIDHIDEFKRWNN